MSTVPQTTIDAVIEASYNMPDAAKDPSLWKHSMKGRLWARVEFRGIKQKEAINDLCTRALDKLEEIGALGEVDQAFQILDRLIAERDAARFASLAPKKMTPAPEPKRPMYDAVQRWLLASYKEQLPKDGALTIVRGWMKAARLYDEKLSEYERLANVTMQAENYAFNRDGAHIAHFASTSHEGHALWMHVHEACAAHIHPVPLNERAGVLLAAIGVKDTLFKYTGTPEQARTKFDAFLPGVGLIPDTDAATKIQEDYMQADTKANSELNEWFPRDEDNQSSDGPFTAQAIADREWKSLWPRLYTLYDAYVTPVGRDRQEYIHDLLDVKSLNDLPADVSDNQIVLNLKAALDARHQLKVNQPEISAKTTPKDSEVPAMQNERTSDTTEAKQTALPEAPFSANFKLISKHGIDVQFTVRAETVNEGVKRVDVTIEKLLEAGWTTQRQPSAAPMQNAQTGGASAPVPQSNGNKPVLTEQIVKIEREFDKDKKLTYTGLYTLFGATPGKYATYKVKDTDAQHLAVLQSVTGKDWSKEPLGSEMGANITAHYTESDKQNAGGKPYHDLVALTA